MIARSRKSLSYTEIIRTLGRIFSDFDSLKQSFLREVSPVSSTACADITKEDIRAMELDADKDVDSSEVRRSSVASSTASSDAMVQISQTVDVEALRRSYRRLFDIKDQEGNIPAIRPLVNNIPGLCQGVELDLKTGRVNLLDYGLPNVIVIILELPMLENPDFLSEALPALCSLVMKLPLPQQAKLARTLCALLRDSPVKMQQHVYTLQQLITTRVLSSIFSSGYCINDDIVVCDATNVLRILFASNILAGDMEPKISIVVDTVEGEEGGRSSGLEELGLEDTEDEDGVQRRTSQSISKTDPLLVELGVDILDCRKPLIELDEFYNELLSEQLDSENDYNNYKEGNQQVKFSFLRTPFVLTPAVRTTALYFDNRAKMFSHRAMSFLSAIVSGEEVNPVFRLRVRRDHIVDDALIRLELTAMESPVNLKKQLVVEFEGEQGIDEGGVSKEFFQLIVEQLFNPDFAMFSVDQETQTYWFNPTSFETGGQFFLIGIILGLAIYNNVILDVRFPMVVYRKLFGKRGTYRDLIDYNPSLARGLHQLLMYQEDDISDTFCQSFRVNYKDVFGTTLSHDLKPNGDDIIVDHSNKVEFVELYADFLLNKSVERQFNAFKRGFDVVTSDSPLGRFFRPEEVELLVCGQKDFDLNALQQSCEYDGYTSESEIIKWFWEVVHDMSDDQKKQLLQFTTGSFRVPVGGLAKLKMIITRHGPDTDRLPGSHTCFNVLLLPEYSSKEKLKERLLKAITYSQGFGML